MTSAEKLQREHRDRVAQMPADIREAHEHCKRNASEIGRGEWCGCFYCLATFTQTEIQDWVEERPRYNNREDLESSEPGRSALCPRCGIDSVLGSASGFPLTAEFLGRMKSYWF
jgi:hypothetical protein